MSDPQLTPHDLPLPDWPQVYNPTQDRDEADVESDADRDDVTPGDEVQP